MDRKDEKNYYSSSPFFLFFHYIPFYSAWVFNSAEEDISSMFIIMEHFAELYSPPHLYSPLPSAYPLPFSTFPSTTFQFASRVCPIPTSCFSSPLLHLLFLSKGRRKQTLYSRILRGKTSFFFTIPLMVCGRGFPQRVW